MHEDQEQAQLDTASDRRPDAFDFCPAETPLPTGIIRIAPEAIASERFMGDACAPTPERPVRIAAFDFDGTCISGSSPKKLVNELMRQGKLSLYKILRIGVWGLAYKFNRPRDDEGVRTRVFSAFAGMPAEQVNEKLCDFYQRRIDPLFRLDAEACMFAHMEAGHEVIVISASFEPIVASAMVEHPIKIALASRMKIDDQGRYTDQVDGLPTEGPAKLKVLRQFADRYYGEGAWEIGWAYGDHFSDLELLSAAENPCAVTPDGKLEEVAGHLGWKVLDWE